MVTAQKPKPPTGRQKLEKSDLNARNPWAANNLSELEINELLAIYEERDALQEKVAEQGFASALDYLQLLLLTAQQSRLCRWDERFG